MKRLAKDVINSGVNLGHRLPFRLAKPGAG